MGQIHHRARNGHRAEDQKTDEHGQQLQNIVSFS